MEMGAGFPEQFISMLRVNNAGSPRRGKSLAMANERRISEFVEAAANMRRLCGSRGAGGRQDALIAGEAVGPRMR